MEDINVSLEVLSIWVNVLGKAMVKKGILTKSEITSELESVKKRFSGKTDKHSKDMVLRINDMVKTVGTW